MSFFLRFSAASNFQRLAKNHKKMLSLGMQTDFKSFSTSDLGCNISTSVAIIFQQFD